MPRTSQTPAGVDEEEQSTGLAPSAPPEYDPGLDADPESSPAATAMTNVSDAPRLASDPLNADATAGDEELPEAFRLNKVYTETPPLPPLKNWRWLLSIVLLVAAGTTGGYLLGHRSVAAQGMSPRSLYLQGVRANVGALDPSLLAEVDAAFTATKGGRYDEARQRFAALHAKHPEWPAMEVEVARDSLYQHDSQGAQNVLGVLSVNRLTPDADFMLGLLHLTNKEFDLAETSFATAVALDPSRPEYFYFWGDCLRRDGKPQEAIDKFRSALLRNQYENAEGLYQLKLWLSEIQAEREESTGGGKEIDDALAQPRPSYEALFAAAGRAIKVNRLNDAADFLTKAQEVTEPAVFRVVMQDPTFLEESASPQLAPFYR